MNLLLGFTVLAFHRHYDIALVGHRCLDVDFTTHGPARPDCVGGTTVVQIVLASPKGGLRKNCTIEGGRRSWHNHNWLESPVVNATPVTIRKVNCATTCRRLIASLSQNKVLSSMGVHNQIALKINLARQKKN